MPGAIGIRCAYTSGTKAESPSRAKSACEQSRQNLHLFDHLVGKQ
jgi:hypothetical protein